MTVSLRGVTIVPPQPSSGMLLPVLARCASSCSEGPKTAEEVQHPSLRTHPSKRTGRTDSSKLESYSSERLLLLQAIAEFRVGQRSGCSGLAASKLEVIGGGVVASLCHHHLLPCLRTWGGGVLPQDDKVVTPLTRTVLYSLSPPPFWFVQKEYH